MTLGEQEPLVKVVAGGLQQQPNECNKTTWAIALENPELFFLSLAPNNPRAQLPCTVGLGLPLKATLSGQKMPLPGFDVCACCQYDEIEIN